MSSPLHFPNAETMKSYLSEHPLLKTDCYQEKGITKAIVDLAVERFADSDKVEMGVKMSTMLMINDLQEGKDGFTEKPLPNLGKLGLNQMLWMQISMATEKALIDCANSKV